MQGLLQNVEQMEHPSPEVTDKVFEGKIRYKQTQQAVEKHRDRNNIMNMNDPTGALQENMAAIGNSRNGNAAAAVRSHGGGGVDQ